MHTMTFGARLRQLRNERGWTQRYVSERLGISGPYLHCLEHDRQRPAEALAELMSALFEEDREEFVFHALGIEAKMLAIQARYPNAYKRYTD